MKINDLFESAHTTIKDVNYVWNQLRLKNYVGKPYSGNLSLTKQKLTSLEYFPSKIEGTLMVDYNQLTSLEHCPSFIEGSFYCDNNMLTSLEFCPRHVGVMFGCWNNPITSLHNIHKYIDHVGSLTVPESVKSHILGVLLINGIRDFEIYGGKQHHRRINEIMLKHLDNTPDKHIRVLECQQELIENGFEEYAQL